MNARAGQVMSEYGGRDADARLHKMAKFIISSSAGGGVCAWGRNRVKPDNAKKDAF